MGHFRCLRKLMAKTVVNYCKALHLRCLRRTWLRLSKVMKNSLTRYSNWLISLNTYTVLFHKQEM